MKTAALIISILLHFNTYGASVKQKELNFEVKGEELLKGDVHYSFALKTKEQLAGFFPDFLELDTTGITKPGNARLIVSKAAYVVNKPTGFFDHNKAVDESYLGHIMGEQKIKKLEERIFRVQIPGNVPQTYKMKTHFDSDDITTTANSRAIRAITGAKNMDIQIKGASSIIVKEMWDYSKGAYGSIHVTAFITITEDKTLVIDYGLMSLIPPLLAMETLEESVGQEASAQQALINSFKDP